MAGTRPKRKRAKADVSGEQHGAATLAPLALRLKEQSKYFDGLIQRIPPRFYLPKEADEEIAAVTKCARTAATAPPCTITMPSLTLVCARCRYTQNHGQKAPKQSVKEASKKAKRAKLDPTQKSAVEIQADRHEKAEAAKSGDDALAEARERLGVRAAPTAAAVSREELLERVRALIDKRRGNRKVPEAGAGKKQKQSKKDRQKEKERKNLVKVPAQSRLPSSVSAAAQEGQGAGGPARKPQVMFSKFDLGKLEKQEAQKKKKKGPLTAKQLLQKVEASKERMEKIAAADPAKAKAMKESDLWNKAMAKASGEKVIDDVSLIKKTIKREEKQKVKTKRQWKSRVGEVEKAKKEKISKRETNLQKRIDQKKAKRLGKVKGGAKKRPGFEGGGLAKKTQKRGK